MQSSTLPTSLLKALRHVMQPLVRLMLRKGVTYLVFADLLKEVFVEVADREFRLGEKAPSDSRISLLTGVHRKDVRRLRNTGDPAASTLPENITFGAQLVNAWASAPFATTPASHSHCLDWPVSVATVPLTPWWRRSARISGHGWCWTSGCAWGSCASTKKSACTLKPRPSCHKKGFDEKAAYLGHNLHDHACAAVHNLSSEGPAFLNAVSTMMHWPQ